MTKGISEEFLVTQFLVAISHMLSKCSINALVDFHQGFACYAGLAAYPASGKSPAIDIIKKSVIDIEDFLEVQHEDSQLVNAEFME
jgi:hypothetical protein